MRKRLLRVLPWLVTAGLLFLLFRRISFTAVIAGVHNAAGWTVPVALLCVAALYLGDSFAIWKTFGWFLTRMSFTDVLLVRGATYLLAAINYNVGQGAIVYFVHRNAGVTIMRGVATILLVLGVNVLALLFLTTGVLPFAADIPQAVRVLVIVAWAGLALYATLVAIRPRWLDRPLFEVLLNAGLGGHLRALAVRIPHIAALIVFQFALLRGFDIRVPFFAAVAMLPVVFLVAVLPISVQGLGTTQTLMVYFFARYAQGDQAAREASIIAASLLGQALAFGFQGLLGVACLKSRVGRALQASAKEQTKTTPPPDDDPPPPAPAD